MSRIQSKSKDQNQKRQDKQIKPGHEVIESSQCSLGRLLADIGIKLISFLFRTLSVQRAKLEHFDTEKIFGQFLSLPFCFSVSIPMCIKCVNGGGTLPSMFRFLVTRDVPRSQK